MLEQMRSKRRQNKTAIIVLLGIPVGGVSVAIVAALLLFSLGYRPPAEPAETMDRSMPQHLDKTQDTKPSTVVEPQYGSIDHFETKVDVQNLAEDAVKERLRYPLDSSFGWFPEVAATRDGRIAVKGTVKSPNAFGAKLTHQYLVILSLSDAEHKTWTIDSVLMDE